MKVESKLMQRIENVAGIAICILGIAMSFVILWEKMQPESLRDFVEQLTAYTLMR